MFIRFPFISISIVPSELGKLMDFDDSEKPKYIRKVISVHPSIINTLEYKIRSIYDGSFVQSMSHVTTVTDPRISCRIRMITGLQVAFRTSFDERLGFDIAVETIDRWEKKWKRYQSIRTFLHRLKRVIFK